ncbi:MAG TPA: hypothetical protein VGN83_21405 [Falsiroseomonas sp.]|jgi:hypothetical protein|nr:hypothetical protein [Falsiroseomonas sp.]
MSRMSFRLAVLVACIAAAGCAQRPVAAPGPLAEPLGQGAFGPNTGVVHRPPAGLTGPIGVVPEIGQGRVNDGGLLVPNPYPG